MQFLALQLTVIDSQQSCEQNAAFIGGFRCGER